MPVIEMLQSFYGYVDGLAAKLGVELRPLSEKVS
jgi:hypothetical protein